MDLDLSNPSNTSFFVLIDPSMQLSDLLNIHGNHYNKIVKYPSPFINLPSFKIVSGFVPDYLHCCLEGVAKQMSDYYATAMTENQIVMVDSMIKKIVATHQISRLSSPFSIRKDWKAREWENFILYYSVPLFMLVLEKKLLDHWQLFVGSLYILLKDDIHIDELNKADEMLHKFVAKTEAYFGLKAMTFNVHQLLHICRGVLNWGPLWSQSTFSFESANFYLLRAIKCAKGVPQQIARFVHINHSALVLQERVYPDASEIIKFYCDDVLFSKAKNISKISTITYFGRGATPADNVIRDLHMSELSKVFQKMVMQGCVYESYLKSKQRSNNAFAQLKNKTYIRIHSFITDEATEKELTVCNFLRTNYCFVNYKELQQVLEIKEEFKIVPTIAIDKICIYMQVDENAYICSLPNLLHY